MVAHALAQTGSPVEQIRAAITVMAKRRRIYDIILYCQGRFDAIFATRLASQEIQSNASTKGYTYSLMSSEFKPKGQPLALDPGAVSAKTGLPAFIAKPENAPVYYGFVVLDDVAVDGFKLGKISDFEAEPTNYGDGFVIAPDDSRCGLVWEVSNESYFQEVCAQESSRWGVWGVSFPHPMNSRENARRNLEFILPKLKEKWLQWRDCYRRESG